jgi:hypothetical protein
MAEQLQKIVSTKKAGSKAKTTKSWALKAGDTLYVGGPGKS